ncbi:MAG: DUF547 domain-containing protein [Pseudomonadota bacterium]
MSSPAASHRRPCTGLQLGLAGLVAFAAASAAALPVSAASPTETFARHSAGATATIDHAAWNRLLQTYVVAGADGVNRVDYARFKKEGHATLKSYLGRLVAADPSSLDRPEQFAYWANLYNAKTIDIVLDKYPIKSIKDINLGGGLVALVTGGPWKAKVVKVSGQDLSLDDIEHAILRPVFKDPRVHYAVNCASFGCPNLGREAFTGAKLDAELDAAARAFLNHPRGIAIDGGKVKASSIYTWFKEDFGSSDAGVLAHVAKYAEPALKEKLKGITTIADFDYDWSLNDVTR